MPSFRRPAKTCACPEAYLRGLARAVASATSAWSAVQSKPGATFLLIRVCGYSCSSLQHSASDLPLEDQARLSGTRPDFGGLTLATPQIMGILKAQPALWRAAQSLGQAQRHLRRDPAAALEDTAQGRRSHIEFFSQFPAGNAVRVQVDFLDEFTRMRGVVHGHQ